MQEHVRFVGRERPEAGHQSVRYFCMLTESELLLPFHRPLLRPSIENLMFGSCAV